ncbi:MAG: peptide chain release factor aRF-1 [Candidatus Micrarchaeota archaeon]|nr:peptide chain release factor aRF-1 [Candidatus Micrarchaeota archaeon]
MAESQKVYEFKKQLKKLATFRGSGTEMISVYIPSGSPMHETSNKLREELGQASNIKSKSTKLNVTGALEKILQHFKLYKKTPENGIAIFAGNTSENTSKIDIELFAMEPPQRLNIGTYRCDSKFFLEPLQRMVDSTDVYGIVVIDGRDAILALVKGTQIDVVKKMHSMAHAKIKVGGQSQRRYQRIIEESIEYFYKRVSEAMDEYFANKVKGVIVGGPGPTKEFFMKFNAFDYRIKVLGVVDTGYTDEYGVREVLAKSESFLVEQEGIKEKILIDRFIKDVIQDGLVTYGPKMVRDAILSKQAESILLSEGLEYRRGEYTCSLCGSIQEKNSKEKLPEKIPCDKCNGEAKITSDTELLENLMDLARSMNIEINIISTDTSEGVQFLNGFTGIGAFLRYRTR